MSGRAARRDGVRTNASDLGPAAFYTGNQSDGDGDVCRPEPVRCLRDAVAARALRLQLLGSIMTGNFPYPAVSYRVGNMA
jgi:hypothetical protein